MCCFIRESLCILSTTYTDNGHSEYSATYDKSTSNLLLIYLLLVSHSLKILIIFYLYTDFLSLNLNGGVSLGKTYNYGIGNFVIVIYSLNNIM